MKSLKFSVIACFATCAAFASAQLEYYTNYLTHVNIGQPVTNIMIAEEHQSGGALTWPFQADGNGSSLLANPFPSPVPYQSAVLIGLVQDLVGDPPGQKHVVLFMNNQAASNVQNIAWGTIFLETNENQLIADIELATSGQDWEIIQPGVDAVSNFLEQAKSAQVGPGGTDGSIWFDLGSSFSVVAFSEGQLIGEGESYIEVVPEPASLAALGIGAVALIRRKRKMV